MKTKFILLSLFITASCSSVQNHSELSQPTGQVLTAGVGEVLYSVKKTHDMPNISGNADIFGRQVDAGAEEVRYLGLKNNSTAKFAYHHVDIYSNESTMSGAHIFTSNTSSNQTANGFATGNSFNASGYGSSNTTGFGISKGNPQVAVLPAGDVAFEQNFKKSPIINRNGVKIEILDADSSSITYRLSSIK